MISGGIILGSDQAMLFAPPPFHVLVHAREAESSILK